jgi:hypothetical protein
MRARVTAARTACCGCTPTLPLPLCAFRGSSSGRHGSGSGSPFSGIGSRALATQRLRAQGVPDETMRETLVWPGADAAPKDVLR